MQKQNFQNHVRYYAPHHFILLPLILVGVVISLVFAVKQTADSGAWYGITAVFLLLGYTSVMLRQHYALTVQDRLVRLEVRFRYFTLTGKRFEPLEQQLSLSQILALRFAADEELPGLVQRAITEQLPAKAIKQSIQQWQGDYMRV
ncbi:hypothetical protein HNQ91_002811 [Filimonas zeae]|uniref:Uncharacterized protein n=1 Tax=Filimonas zeae TaxID=1737353 RepID=A0A917MWA9_9BACT|nr:DUF6526 family protein [Filimonas zeae]MDR6339746.1 hypothetical protein [Filimonas zeae]GGH69449.1 hypothetical protein GCM10011379_26760 [Filimonas zeae]